MSDQKSPDVNVIKVMNFEQLDQVRDEFESTIAANYGFPISRLVSLRDNWGYLDQEVLNIPGMWDAWKLARCFYKKLPSEPGISIESGISINGWQLQNALEFLAPDMTTGQLSGSVTIKFRPNILNNGELMPSGLYARMDDCPEEGLCEL